MLDELCELDELFSSWNRGREGHAPGESFDDLDEGFQPVGFWDREGKKGPKKK